MLYWVFASIATFVAELPLREVVTRYAAYFAGAVLPLGTEFVLTRAAPLFDSTQGYSLSQAIRVLLSGSAAGPARTTLVRDGSGKVHWFIHEPLLNTLNLANIQPSVTLGILVAIFIVSGLVLYFRGPLLLRLFKVGLALGLVPLAYLPNLLVSENWASYRSELALVSLFALYAALALLGYVRTLGNSTWLATALLAVFACVFVVSAAVNSLDEIALPQYTEYNLVTARLKAANLADITTIEFIPASWTDSVSPVGRYDEFGEPSSVAPWAQQNMVYLALRDVNAPNPDMQVVVMNSPPTGTVPAGVLVINMHDLRSYGPERYPPNYQTP
jgi:hypothetical protein